MKTIGDQVLVFSVIRNGIRNGYPFLENYASWLGYCDKLLILDGHSTDGTWEVLKLLQSQSDKIILKQSPWPSTSKGGSSIAQFTNTALEVARPLASHLIYIQADELLPPEGREFLFNPEKFGHNIDDVFEVNKYTLFWNGFDRILDLSVEGIDETQSWIPWHAIRRFPSSLDLKSIGDGLSFEISSQHRIVKVECPEPILHYGWCFPVNILQKHISHANLYRNHLKYQRRGHLAMKLLMARSFERSALDRLDPDYIKKAKPYDGRHPALVWHLLDSPVYNPYIGLSMIKGGLSAW